MTTSLQPAYALVPGANLEAYVNTVNSIPLLTPEQERELAESLYYEQDLGAARQMVLAHLRFVVHIARSYSGYGPGSGRPDPGRQRRPDEGGQTF